MNGSHKQATKKGKSLSRGELFCLVLVVSALILAVGALLRGHFSTTHTGGIDASVDIGEYERLLVRAKELTKQYAALAGPQGQVLRAGASTQTALADQRQLPTSVLTRPSLLQTEDLHQHGQSPSMIVQSNSAQTDLILGMAQDTDAKNLVSAHTRHRMYPVFHLSFLCTVVFLYPCVFRLFSVDL